MGCASIYMGDHLVTADTESNQTSVCQTKQSLVNNIGPRWIYVFSLRKKFSIVKIKNEHCCVT